MVYFSVKLTIGKEEGFIAKSSKNLLNTWNKAVFFTDYKKAKDCMLKSCWTAKGIFPRRKVSAVILANDAIPSNVEIIK